MRTLPRHAAATATTAALVLVLSASAQPALAAAPVGAAAPAAAPVGLPSYRTWLDEVSTVTDEASRYLASRLPDPHHRTAIVLDIDNTALESTYGSAFGAPATQPVLAIALQAKSAGAAVFFVTGRPESLRRQTLQNLDEVGYPVDGLTMRPSRDSRSLAQYKTSARIDIENRGYIIVANIGNNTTDLTGGHAEAVFKLPDYDGRLG